MRAAPNPVDVGKAPRRAFVLGNFYSGEARRAVIRRPPAPVASVKRMRPRRYLEGVVNDGDAEGRVPRDLEVDRFDAGSPGDDDDGAAAPVWEPERSAFFIGAGGLSFCLSLLRAACRLARGPRPPGPWSVVIVGSKGRALGAALPSSLTSNGLMILRMQSSWNLALDMSGSPPTSLPIANFVPALTRSPSLP